MCSRFLSVFVDEAIIKYIEEVENKLTRKRKRGNKVTPKHAKEGSRNKIEEDSEDDSERHSDGDSKDGDVDSEEDSNNESDSDSDDSDLDSNESDEDESENSRESSKEDSDEDSKDGDYKPSEEELLNSEVQVPLKKSGKNLLFTGGRSRPKRIN